MNLNAYDDVSPKLDKNKTWLNKSRKELISREIKYRKYYIIVKRYNIEENNYDYFVALLDDEDQSRIYHTVKYDNYGRIKISLSSIWDAAELYNYENNINITIEHTEHTDDGDIYKIDV